MLGTGPRRLTFVHNDDADCQQLNRTTRTLQFAGSQKSDAALRTFNHPVTRELVEIEPGGSDVSGHFLHFMSDLAR